MRLTVSRRDGSEVPRPTPGETVTDVAASLAALTVLGAPLSVAAKLFLSDRQNRRLERFLWELPYDLETVLDRIDVEHRFFQSEVYADLIEETVDRAASTRRLEKLDAFRAIFLNTLFDEPSYEEGIEILEVVTGWQPFHLEALRAIASGADIRPPDRYVPGRSVSISEDAIVRQIGAKIDAALGWDTGGRGFRAARRFVQDGLGTVTLSLTPMRSFGEQGLGVEGEVRITPFAERVVAYITNPAGGEDSEESGRHERGESAIQGP